MLKELIDAVMRVVFGHNAVDNTSDWYKARQKSKVSRDELERVIRQSDENTQ